MNEGLACRCLARAPLHDVAHDDLFHGRLLHSGPGHCLADDERAKLRSGERGETTEIAPDRRTDSGDEDWSSAITHWIVIRFGFARRKLRGKGTFVTLNRETRLRVP